MPTAADSPKHLVLVHGLCHGAWCWYKLMTHLKSAGHRVSAVDLGGCGVHPSRPEEVTDFSDYVQPLFGFLESLSGGNDRVVLVGHSFGGLAISMAMERFPEMVSVGVFISAYMPNCIHPPPALQMKQYFESLKPELYMDCRFTFKNGSPATAELGSGYMADMMYQNCQPEDLALANLLTRPSHLYLEDMSKDNLLTKDKYGSISRVYVVCEGDLVMNEEFQRLIIKDSPPNEVKSVPGAGHMIMLSKCKEICLYLEDIVARYP